MTLENRKKLTQLIHRRERIAKRLAYAYEHNHVSTKLEIQLDNVTWKIKDIVLPGIHTTYMNYDNA